MTEEIQYQNIINDFLSGTHYGVFIDDTGSPGETSYKFLPSGRKTWVAVVIPPSQMKETLINFNTLLNSLKKQFGVSEFHFTDIFGGNREYRNISWANRLGIINTLAKAFENYKYTIIQQSLEPSQLSEWKNMLELPIKLPFFNFKKVEDIALFILILKIRSYIQGQQSTEKGEAHVIVDEGWKKNNVALISEIIFGKELDRSKICFGSSKNIVLLQLADFAAFVLNRMQIVGSKDVVSKKELHFLKVTKPMTHLYRDVSRKQMLINNKTGKSQPINALDRKRLGI